MSKLRYKPGDRVYKFQDPVRRKKVFGTVERVDADDRLFPYYIRWRDGTIGWTNAGRNVFLAEL